MRHLFFKILKYENFTLPINEAIFLLYWLFDTDKERKELLWKIRKHTMVGYPRLKSLYNLALEVEKKALEGAFIECGVWKGGCSAILTYINQKHGNLRKTYLFDSFEGLPEPTELDGHGAKIFAQNRNGGTLSPISKNVGPIETVKDLLFNKLNLKEENTRFIKGWFQDTLPKESRKIGNIAILRLDGDWYESTKTCLENLYDNVVPGGYIIFDDYNFWEGCKKATEEFFSKRGIVPIIQRIDNSGIVITKTH